MNNILLCGFMGCGKTTVGRQLARQLDREYLDLDVEIAAEVGRSIPLIFEQLGEETFRSLEHEALKKTAGRRNCIVSTGGGALTFPRNVAAIDPTDQVIFLDVPFDTCYNRIKNSDRPIVRAHTRDELHAIFTARRAAYLSASSLRISVDAPVRQIIDLLAGEAGDAGDAGK